MFSSQFVYTPFTTTEEVSTATINNNANSNANVDSAAAMTNAYTNSLVHNSHPWLGKSVNLLMDNFRSMYDTLQNTKRKLRLLISKPREVLHDEYAALPGLKLLDKTASHSQALIDQHDSLNTLYKLQLYSITHSDLQQTINHYQREITHNSSKLAFDALFRIAYNDFYKDNEDMIEPIRMNPTIEACVEYMVVEYTKRANVIVIQVANKAVKENNTPLKQSTDSQLVPPSVVGNSSTTTPTGNNDNNDHKKHQRSDSHLKDNQYDQHNNTSNNKRQKDNHNQSYMNNTTAESFIQSNLSPPKNTPALSADSAKKQQQTAAQQVYRQQHQYTSHNHHGSSYSGSSFGTSSPRPGHSTHSNIISTSKNNNRDRPNVQFEPARSLHQRQQAAEVQHHQHTQHHLTAQQTHPRPQPPPPHRGSYPPYPPQGYGGNQQPPQNGEY